MKTGSYGKTWVGAMALALMVVTIAACGGGNDSTPTSPTPTPPTDGGGGGGGTQGTTITIQQNGVMSPSVLTVSPGTRVTFLNNDSRNREMHSDPHPTHGDCPEIDQVGFLTTGQSKQTGNLNTVRTCGYHDHNDPDKRGTIRIQ